MKVMNSDRFKVGDWVINTTHPDPKPMLVTQKVLDDKSPFNNGNHIQPWQPKEGEWCWFVFNDTAYLGKMVRHTPDDWEELYYQYKDQSGNYMYAHSCEPFIGELPSWVKQNETP